MSTSVYGGPDGEYHSGLELLRRTQQDGWQFVMSYDDRLVLSPEGGDVRVYVEVPESRLPEGVSLDRGSVADDRKA
jgi:hypothetical protein